MDFAFNEEQDMLKDSFQRFLQDSYDFESYRKIAASESGVSPEFWQQTAELQWQALAFDESVGGLGYGHIELMLLGEEMGRGLCIEPYMANVVLAGQAIAALGSEEQKSELLGALFSGEQQISLAYNELASHHQLSHCECRAEGDGDQWKLSGRKSLVLNAPNADKLVVLARRAGDVADRQGLGLYLVDKTASGLSLQSYSVLGGGVAAEVELQQTPATPLGGANVEALEALEDVIDLATAYSCAEAYGAMQALLAKTAEYSKTRKQFGQPLGAFQVLQHRMVDMFVEVQQSQSMILMMMLKLSDPDRRERQKAVSAGKAYLHKASKFVAQQAVQLHGGIGVTEELDIGHYFRRLTAFGNLFGNRLHHLRRYAALDRAPEQAKSIANAA